MTRWLAFAPLAVLALLAVLFGAYALRHDPTFVPAALVGKPLPAVALPDFDGAPVGLRDTLRGTTFVNVFASWCAPCAEESPTLLAMQDQGAHIVGVAYKDEPEASRGFLVRYGNPFAVVLFDRDGRAGVELGVSGVPETFLVGADGMVLAKHSGALTLADVQAMLVQAQAAIR